MNECHVPCRILSSWYSTWFSKFLLKEQMNEGGSAQGFKGGITINQTKDIKKKGASDPGTERMTFAKLSENVEFSGNGGLLEVAQHFI